MTQTQNQRLLRHLQQHGRIDPMTAWQELGIYRLGARIYDLRQLGTEIVKKSVSVTNKFGERCNVAEYRIKQAGGTT